MSLSSNFRRTMSVMVDRHTSSAEARRRVAAVARDGLTELIRTGRASTVYQTTVDGRRNAPLETVRLDKGRIEFIFGQMARAAEFAVDLAKKRSPVKGGKYRDSWFVLVDKKPWTAPLATIPSGVEVWITNAADYHRKIDRGGQKTKMPPYIVEDVRQAVQRRFPGLDAGVDFVTLPGGYVLKGYGWDSGLSFRKRLNPSRPDQELGWNRRFAKPKANGRPDRAPGVPMTYPTIIISEKGS
jgi:hypothetical protein